MDAVGRIRFDCRHFAGERPCNFHKASGVKCWSCVHYDPISSNILVIKLGATGDVLRTTSILRGLKEKFGGAHITWITKRESLSLFEGNPFVDRVLEHNAASYAEIQLREFDLVISLDTSPESAQVATLAKAKRKIGFGYHPKGHVYPFNKEAEEWFLMGIDDDLKKRNKKTYQEIISKMCGLEKEHGHPVFNLYTEEIAFGEEFARKSCINNRYPIIGLNTGAGSRWEKKKWTQDGFLELIRTLHREMNATILLYGGPLERQRNQFLLENSSNQVLDTGLNNSIREFASLIRLCDLLVTADTLALHIAVALGKKVVALFGPTSSHEIDLCGLGEKLSADHLDCLCCYKQKCDRKPDCMESITPGMVIEAVRKLLS